AAHRLPLGLHAERLGAGRSGRVVERSGLGTFLQLHLPGLDAVPHGGVVGGIESWMVHGSRPVSDTVDDRHRLAGDIGRVLNVAAVRNLALAQPAPDLAHGLDLMVPTL